ncbi:uncharacterized protein LOC143301336 [Babylonia areolata]|uniref:uncharacterized protein LOC143301336 n=1 Tax=Babylonia areolata TaxID=304850 RepID=UPI003FD4572A
MGAGDDKPVGKPQVSVGVSIPDSVVAPLIGAGANVYIMTNELTQSMREKLGTSWPFVQDRLNSRYVKLLAGGLLASVAVILVWKIIKRFTAAKAAKPDDEEDEPCEWTTKTYELTPVSDGKRRSSKSEGDGPDSLHLPAKIQLRVAEAPVQATKTAEPEICKAREPATRHRHTRHLEHRQGELTAADGFSPWHSEQPRGSDSHCSCTTELCSPFFPPRPRLLYSAKASRVMQYDPNLENVMTYMSSPSALCPPPMMESACPHGLSPQPCYLGPHGMPACAPCVSMVPNRLASHHHLFHPPLNEVTYMTYPSHLSSCPPLHHGVHPNSFLPYANAGLGYISVPQSGAQNFGVPYRGGVTLSSVEESRGSGITEVTEAAGRQTPTSEMQGRSRTVQSKARSVSQQTDGQPVDESLDMPASVNDVRHSVTFQTAQNIPTRTAQSPVTPSQCKNTPIRTDSSQMHVRSSVSRPTRMSSVSPSRQPTVCQTSQGAMIQLSAGGECPGAYPTVHHAVHIQHPSVMETFDSRPLLAPSHLQPLTYQHVSVDHMLPPLVEQHHTARCQPAQGQQQQPVVQHPSECSMSQNSPEECSSHEIREHEEGQTSTGSQETVAPEVLPQERSLLPQQPYSRPRASTPVSPHPIVEHHHHASSLPALTDYAHDDYPWQRPQGLHSHQHNPYFMGYQSPYSKYYPPFHNPWSVPPPMFFAPPFMAPNANFFLPPTGMMGPTAQQEHFMTSQWQAPYLYPHTHMSVPRQTTYSPNFNLSNSNAHAFIQETSQSSVQVLPFPPESSSLRVIESDHSLNSSQTSTVQWAESADSSDISFQTLGADGMEVMRNDALPLAGLAAGHDAKNLQSGGTLLTELAVTSERSPVFPHEGVGSSDSDDFQGSGIPPDDTEVLHIMEYVEELSSPPYLRGDSAPCDDGMGTLL